MQNQHTCTHTCTHSNAKFPLIVFLSFLVNPLSISIFPLPSMPFFFLPPNSISLLPPLLLSHHFSTLFKLLCLLYLALTFFS